MRSTRFMLVPGLLSVVLSSLADAARQPIGTLFQYYVGENDAGSCKKYGEDRLNRILDDVYTLATENSQVMVDYGDDDADKQDAAKRLVNVMFQRPSEDERQLVATRTGGVKNWLENGGNVNNGKNPEKPYLFCGDSWAIRQDMKSQMRDGHGTELVKKKTGKPIRIKDIDSMVKTRSEVAQELGRSEKSIYPYWVPAFKGYYFDKKYSDNVEEGACTKKDVIAFTVNRGELSAIVLCDKVFTDVRLHDKPVKAFESKYWNDDKSVPVPGHETNIKDVVPEARSFYHELFHLYWGPEMDPAGNEEYVFRRMTGEDERRDGGKFEKPQAMKNPENYALQAVAYDYTLSVTAGPNSKYPVEFYTGYATFTK